MASKPEPRSGSNSDPFNIHQRVERQIDMLLKEMEDEPERFDFKSRLSMVQIVGMYLTRNIKLNAADESDNSGSTVRRYAGAFKTKNAGSGGTPSTRRASLAIAHDSDDDDTAA
jgi:hypothetical protein